MSRAGGQARTNRWVTDPDQLALRELLDSLGIEWLNASKPLRTAVFQRTRINDAVGYLLCLTITDPFMGRLDEGGDGLLFVQASGGEESGWQGLLTADEIVDLHDSRGPTHGHAR